MSFLACCLQEPCTFAQELATKLPQMRCMLRQAHGFSWNRLHMGASLQT